MSKPTVLIESKQSFNQNQYIRSAPNIKNLWHGSIHVAALEIIIMNELLSAISIFLLGILATVAAVWIVQVIASRSSKLSGVSYKLLVSPEEYLIEKLVNMPDELSRQNRNSLLRGLQKRYQLSRSAADQLLTAVVRSSAFERVTGARCTCYADSKKYGKYFHAPSCEYRKHVEGKSIQTQSSSANPPKSK